MKGRDESASQLQLFLDLLSRLLTSRCQKYVRQDRGGLPTDDESRQNIEVREIRLWK